MAKVEVYFANWCGYCKRAMALLDSKGIDYVTYDIDQDGMRDEMIERSSRTSVPQIFIDGEHIGGCDDLFDLDKDGKL